MLSARDQDKEVVWICLKRKNGCWTFVANITYDFLFTIFIIPCSSPRYPHTILMTPPPSCSTPSTPSASYVSLPPSFPWVLSNTSAPSVFHGSLAPSPLPLHPLHSPAALPLSPSTGNHLPRRPPPSTVPTPPSDGSTASSGSDSRGGVCRMQPPTRHRSFFGGFSTAGDIL